MSNFAGNQTYPPLDNQVSSKVPLGGHTSGFNTSQPYETLPYPSQSPHTYQPLETDPDAAISELPFDSNNASVRLGFIRKVYYIITAMLIVTFGLVCITYFVPAFRAFQIRTTWLLIVATVLMVIILYTLACFRAVARSVPWNYLLLLIFTLCMAYIVSYTTAMYTGESIIIAVGLTTAVVIALTLYAIFTTTDFTTCGGVLIVLGVAMLIGTIIGIFLKNRWFDVAMGVFGCITFGIYLVVDTQLVIGKNSRSYSIDDYVMAAVAIYLDIINLFLQILKIVGAFQRR
jgi:hypothetical protein